MSIFSNSSIKFPWLVKNIASKPIALWIIFSIVPIVGLILEKLDFDLAFSRSGSVLVALAIFSVFLNHFLSVEIRHARSALDSVLKIGDTAEDIQRRLNTEIKGEVRIDNAKKLEAFANLSKQAIPEYEKIKENIVVVEFVAGVSGTLIWGFGDLVKYIL